MLNASPDFIIAIGASAGGLKEIDLFFSHTPSQGVAYVVVQHLSSAFKSHLAEILAKHSKLAVREAENGMPVVANEVYIIPNDKFMAIDGGVLHLTSKEQSHIPHLTINKFFISLAQHSGSKAIAILLSGLGIDGTEGARAIKNAGGFVLARNPENSLFGSMPANAIAEGQVDFIEEPQNMPATIEAYIRGIGAIPVLLEEEKEVAQIVELIKQQLPLDFTGYKQTTIARRIKRRASFKNFTSLTDYFNFLKNAPEEVGSLSKDFLISVTSFFRDKDAFAFIQKNVLPAILEKLAPGEELKLWVAGCATGEEAYSLAILIAEQLTGKYKNTVVKIFATDIDSAAVVHAGKGIYSSAIAKDVAAGRLEKYFIKEGDTYRVSPMVRKMMIFATHDIIKNPPYCNVHFISCRNLLIYMTPMLQKKIFSLLLFGLKKDGYLFLGSSENPVTILEHLDVVNKMWKVYQNIETKRIVHLEGFAMPQMIAVADKTAMPYHGSTVQKLDTGFLEPIYTTLLNEIGSLAVCIDENNGVVKTYGNTERYILQKNFNTNLAELLPRPLAVAFSTLSSKARLANESVKLAGIKIKNNEGCHSVNLSVSPIINRPGGQKFLMVTFSENKIMAAEKDASAFDEKTYPDQYTLMLEEELNELKDKLSRTYEQLDASNDNMQSYNEGLLSANEEMQSTNEEMQSVNEELYTVNTDYQVKNRELLELNDDLNNYFRSNINGQLFVNSHLQLIKFSPGTVKLINLLPSDAGRPLSDISTNIKFETIIQDIQQVIASGATITKEIETNSGLCYQASTMPYITLANNKASGAVVTFTDITELKKTQSELDKKNKSLQRINEDLNNFVLTASHDLLTPLTNIELSIGLMNEIKVTDPMLSKSLEIINSSVKKFRSLIKDISVIAKIENDMMAMEMVNIEDIITGIEWSLENSIRASKAIITTELAVKEVLFSKKNLRSILYNLISNSIKFKADRPPEIFIRTAKEEQQVMLSIQDNGKGIPKDGLEKIFGMYGRLHHDVEGQGIGLYLAKKIINASEGNIILQSELGIGSKFIIHFKAETQL